jgi:F0F1-type ATP synthase assembly protein I
MYIVWTPFLRLTVISVCLFLAAMIFSLYAPEEFVSKNILGIVPFFYLSTLASILIHLRLKKTRSSYAKMFYLISSGVKMIVYIILLILYGVYFRNDVIPFFISFLFFYLIYTYLDVKSTLALISK